MSIRRMNTRQSEPPVKGWRGWSLDLVIWKDLAEVEKNLIWTRKAFHESRQQEIPEKSGVYLICAHPPNVQLGDGPRRALADIRPYSILYAGRTTNLHRRFREHLGETKSNEALRKCIIHYNKMDFWYAEAQNLDRLEPLLLYAFNPPCNTQPAPGTKALRARLGIKRPIGTA